MNGYLELEIKELKEEVKQLEQEIKILKETEADQVDDLKQAVRLLNSMIASGELHSDDSRRVVRTALRIP